MASCSSHIESAQTIWSWDREHEPEHVSYCALPRKIRVRGHYIWFPEREPVNWSEMGKTPKKLLPWTWWSSFSRACQLQLFFLCSLLEWNMKYTSCLSTKFSPWSKLYCILCCTSGEIHCTFNISSLATSVFQQFYFRYFIL